MNALDTNVLIYACDKRDPLKQQQAIELIGGLADGILLWQVACEFIASTRKLADQGFTSRHAWQRLSEFMDVLPLQIPTGAVFVLAQQLHVQQHWSYWDALVVAAARETGATRLYSEDLPGRGSTPGLEILNPFAG